MQRNGTRLGALRNFLKRKLPLETTLELSFMAGLAMGQKEKKQAGPRVLGTCFLLPNCLDTTVWIPQPSVPVTSFGLKKVHLSTSAAPAIGGRLHRK